MLGGQMLENAGTESILLLRAVMTTLGCKEKRPDFKQVGTSGAGLWLQKGESLQIIIGGPNRKCAVSGGRT